MTTFLFANNAGTTLGTAAAPTDGTLTVVSAAEFPTPGAGQAFALTLQNSSATVFEICYVTNVSGNVLTVLRGQEGTAAASWPIATQANNYWTQGQAAALVQQPQLQIQAGNYAADSGSADALVVTLNPVPVNLASLLGAPIRVKKGASANATTTPTLAVNGFAATTIVYPGGGALAAGTLAAGGVLEVIYDGTHFELISTQNISSLPPSGPAGGDLTGTYPNPTVAANAVTNTKLATMPANTVKANITGAVANAADVALSSFLTWLGLGSVYAGTNGHFSILGIIVQWGSISMVPTGASYIIENVTFDGAMNINFPNNCWVVVGNSNSNNDNDPTSNSNNIVAIFYNRSTSGFTCRTDTDEGGTQVSSYVWWIAIGN